MENLRHDSKKFSESYKDAVEKSSVRKTSREKDAKKLGDRFAEQAENMEKEFDHHKKADTTLPVAYQTMNELDRLMRDIALEGVPLADFEKVRTEMSQVAQQFSYQP